jgi:hypothetical protein
MFCTRQLAKCLSRFIVLAAAGCRSFVCDSKPKSPPTFFWLGTQNISCLFIGMRRTRKLSEKQNKKITLACRVTGDRCYDFKNIFA